MQFAIMKRHAADGFFNGVPQAYLECHDHNTWARACGIANEHVSAYLQGQRREDKGGHSSKLKL